MPIEVPAPNAHAWFLFASVGPRKVPSEIETPQVKAFVGQLSSVTPRSVREQLLIVEGPR